MADLAKKQWQYSTLLLLGLTWGSSFILMKQGLRSFQPIEVALIRISASFLFLLPWMIPQYLKIPRKKLKFLLLSGLLGNGIPAVFFCKAPKKILSKVSGILKWKTPNFTFLVGGLFFGLLIRRQAVIGLIIGLIGTIYIVYSSNGIGENNNYIYTILPVVASLCYGFSSNIIKTHLYDLSPLVVTGGALSFIGPPSVLSLILFTDVPKQIVTDSYHLQNFGWLMILGIVGTSLAVLIFNYLIKNTTVLFAASVTYLIPIFAMVWGLIFGESITIHYFISIVVILSGVYIANK
ncbi:MAG: EamA family transporter [Flavobacteriales bacterium]|nr:EamA family transporter [Flavobacteriales bacterium]